MSSNTNTKIKLDLQRLRFIFPIVDAKPKKEFFDLTNPGLVLSQWPSQSSPYSSPQGLKLIQAFKSNVQAKY